MTPPGYHPVLIAQAWATLEEMFPALMNNSGADPHTAIEVYEREVLPRLSRSLSLS